MSVESPHMTRWSPKIQTSPVTLTGSGAADAGASSGTSLGGSSSGWSNWSISRSEKPMTERSKSRSSSEASSVRSMSLSQTAFSAIRLSAITYALFCSWLNPVIHTQGTLGRLSSNAANRAPCPASTVPVSSITTGLVKPNSDMLRAICCTCSGLCVFELLAQGVSVRGSWSV